MVTLHTEYRARHRYGPGFYNILTYKEPTFTSEVDYGPYHSRPLARVEAGKIRARIQLEEGALGNLRGEVIA